MNPSVCGCVPYNTLKSIANNAEFYVIWEKWGDEGLSSVVLKRRLFIDRQ